MKTDGLLRGLTGVDYCRTREWPLVANMLAGRPGEKVLDVGSGDASMFPLLIALPGNIDLTVLDYSDEMGILKERFSTLATKSPGVKQPTYLQGDIRDLPFETGTFDKASCVSTIEHIPGSGDQAGMAELVRVLKPGGRLVVSVPFNTLARDEFKMDKAYERAQENEPVFFQRIYDPVTFKKLITIEGTVVEEERYLVEPDVPYFWMQDCSRSVIDGRLILGAAPAQNRLSRSLHVWRALSYIKESAGPLDGAMVEKAVVAAASLRKL